MAAFLDIKTQKKKKKKASSPPPSSYIEEAPPASASRAPAHQDSAYTDGRTRRRLPARAEGRRALRSQEQHNQLPTAPTFPNLASAMRDVLTSDLRILRPYAENDITHNHAANLRNQRPRTYRQISTSMTAHGPFPTTRPPFLLLQ